MVMFKTHSKATKGRSPGPGPIKKRDWLPMARKWLKGRCVFIHTDGARSHKIGMNRKTYLDGVIHDYVVHKQKKINGVWVKPKYVKLVRHKMLDGKIICTKAGTQIIDRCWKHVRKTIGERSISASGR